LPQPIVDAVTNDPYDKGDCDYSVTELIGPPRIRKLKQWHDHEIEEDVSDRIYALLGQIGHLILERAAAISNDVLVEKRFFLEVDNHFWVSGQVDGLIKKDNWATVVDYKVTAIGSVLYGLKDEWVQQVNLNAYLARQNGWKVNAGQIVAIFRDWSKRELKRRRRQNLPYPDKPVQVFPIPMWDDEECLEFINHRIFLHEKSEYVLPECTEKERWAAPSKWAVKKVGGKRAINGGVCDSESEAEAFRVTQMVETFIEHRPGESIRCEDYCVVAAFCEQFKKEKENDV
jgi:hypothetical protein